ncbi:hypothetical protein NW767_012894 [Fusarium falciforme]|nr:hypothetical protein NW767_012894 [Fusarium falciforme]
MEIMGLPCDSKAVDAELITMLIALLPNMDHLSLWQGHWSLPRFYPSAFQALGITSLPKLKTLETEINPHPIMALATGLETLNPRKVLASPTQDVDLPNHKTLRLARITCKKENVPKGRDRIWSRLPPSIVSLHLIKDDATKLEPIQEGLIGLVDMKNPTLKCFQILYNSILELGTCWAKLSIV